MIYTSYGITYVILLHIKGLLLWLTLIIYDGRQLNHLFSTKKNLSSIKLRVVNDGQ